MLGPFAGFDWDEGNRAKCQRHGVPLVEIEALLLGDPAVAPDLQHSADEYRFIAAGRNSAGRAMFVAFTVRVRDGRRLLRPVTARYMHAKESERYDATRTQAPDRRGG
jgi:uncharacterized DUF497 family protein